MSTTRTFEDYVKEELKYYDEHPEEDDHLIECHTNESIVDICYMD